jgi:3-hydroxyacyl-CoA dehydrogenase/enoyl-CoA hydratase/3-hydroxybutyryl-CoA epimerase
VIHYDLDADGVATLTVDMDGSANTMNAAFRADFLGALDRLEADRDAGALTGAVITSAKKTFFAGGDINELYTVTAANAEAFVGVLDEIKAALRRLETLGRPVAAAVNGSALGGGLELALSCHHRVVLDRPDVRLGFPEVTLGLLPGAGGIVKTVRLMGVQAALPLLAEGKQLRPAAAVKAGWAHELAADPDELLAKAKAWVLAHPDAVQPWDAPGVQGKPGVADLRPFDPESYGLLSLAPAVLRKKTHGRYPAPEKILAAAVEGAQLDFDSALKVETRYFVELAVGQVAKNMIGTFWFKLNEIKAGASRPQGIEKRSVGRVAVLGAGMMGAGIAHVSALSGVEVVLKDVDRSAAERAKAKIAAQLDDRVAKGRTSQAERDAVLARITPADDYAALAGCDLVIEAVFEQRDLKNEVNAAAAAAVGPDAVLASNTSTLPITGLAGAVPDPARFVGLHFFSPVEKMPLVEIIRGADTSDETLARAYDFVQQIRKTPIVVHDSRGFYTSRTFGVFVNEGIRMVAEGVHPALVENIARRAGFPVGPLAVTDEVTLTLPLKVRDQAVADLGAAGNGTAGNGTGDGGAAQAGQEQDVVALELAVNPAFDLLEELVHEHGRTGKAGGAGFYDYPADGPKRLWPALVERYAKAEAPVAEQDVHDRLLYIQALESIRCLQEGVLDSTRDADVGSIMGIGFPGWTGGAIQFVNSCGVRAFTERAGRLAEKYGERFRPPALLLQKAENGERF